MSRSKFLSWTVWGAVASGVLMLAACANGPSATAEPVPRAASSPVEQIAPPAHLSGAWRLAPDFSDEFNTTKVDSRRWETDVRDWGTWSWESENVVQTGGNLEIVMRYQPHKRSGEDYYLTSGIIKSQKTIRYGYFEARIKAAHILPGTCPAFWMKGDGPGRQSSEVDFMELRESNPKELIATNLHAHVDTNGDGKPEWIRQNRFWKAPWDPRDDFHIYAALTTPEEIIWYIDGVEVNRAANTYWHFEMNVMLSMGVRTPYRTFKKPAPDVPEGVANWPDPVATQRDKDLFPTTMLVDWVRVWEPIPPTSIANISSSEK